MRLDLFLKTSRLVKRRALAKELCEADRVLVNGRKAQPAKEVRQGDRVTVRYSAREIELEVLALPERPSAAGKQEPYRVLFEKRISAEEGL